MTQVGVASLLIARMEEETNKYKGKDENGSAKIEVKDKRKQKEKEKEIDKKGIKQKVCATLASKKRL